VARVDSGQRNAGDRLAVQEWAGIVEWECGEDCRRGDFREVPEAYAERVTQTTRYNFAKWQFELRS
jgi:hypothetical protein